MEPAPPPHPDDLDWLRKEVGSVVPAEYLAFMEQHDGVTADAGELWCAAEVGRGRDVAPEVDHLAELVLFGSDGGLEVFAFDERGEVVVIPWIGSERDAIPQGSFTEFLARLDEGRSFDRGAGSNRQPAPGGTRMSMITGTDFITVPTKDFEASAAFYRDVLGLEEGKRWGNMPAGEFETGNLTIAILQSDAFGLEFKPHTYPIEFRVDDFEGTKAELESRGVQFKGDVIDSGVCYQTFFEDPDGNALAIHHRYAPH